MKHTERELSTQEIYVMEKLDWIHLGQWLFFKSGKVYDLSAADLTQLELIEKKELFVVAK